jgi:hypothetical protein
MIDVSNISTDTPSQGLAPKESSSTERSRKDRLVPDNSDKSNKENEEIKRSLTTGTQDLSPEELRDLTELKQRDREVKSHEQAHVAAGGSYVRSGAQYEYEKGPDGQKYAVEGEVQIDTSKVPGDPEATIRKMQVVRSAALAPANPSAKDRSVAAEATRIENQTRREMLTKRYSDVAALGPEENGTESENSNAPAAANPAISLGGLIDLLS